MAQNNDVINLVNSGTVDNYVYAAELSGTTLVLHLVSGTDVTVDLSTIADEFGGVRWESSHTYVAGDVVTDAGIAYIAITESTGDLPASNPTSWIPVVALEWNGAGARWYADRTYNRGDIVTDGAIPPKLWVSAEDDNLSNALPIDGLSDDHWLRIGTEYHSATSGGVPNNNGMHCPESPTRDPGDTEYPDTSSESVGAIWQIDCPTDSPYTFVGGSLHGVTVSNGDKIVFVGGTNSGTPGDGSEVWLYTAATKVSAERGGLAWRNNYEYIIGDIVTQNNDPYVSIVGDETTPNEGYPPDSNPDKWDPLIDTSMNVTSVTSGTETRIAEIVSISQTDYDAIGAGNYQADKLYIIV